MRVSIKGYSTIRFQALREACLKIFYFFPLSSNCSCVLSFCELDRALYLWVSVHYKEQHTKQCAWRPLFCAKESCNFAPKKPNYAHQIHLGAFIVYGLLLEDVGLLQVGCVVLGWLQKACKHHVPLFLSSSKNKSLK